MGVGEVERQDFFLYSVTDTVINNCGLHAVISK